MQRSTISLLVLLGLIAALLGFNYFKHPFATNNQAAVTVTPAPDVTPTTVDPNSTLSAEQKIASLLAYPVIIPKAASPSATVAPTDTSLTLGAQFVQDLAWISQYHPAVITLYGTKIANDSMQTVIQQIKAQYSTDQQPLIAIDHEGGTTQRLSGTGFTTLPSWRSLCAETASESAQILTQSLHEVKAAGVDIVLAPVTDVSASNPVLGNRICSGDPDLVVERGSQYAQIATDLHLLPVFKHFPGIGASRLDLHQSFDRVTITAAEAQVYKQLLDRYPTAGVMVAHVGVTNQFPDKPCSLSADCVSELATNYPQTLILTDALDMKAASYLPAASQGATASASAGLKLSLPQVAEAAVRAGDQVLLFSQAVTSDQMTEVWQHLVDTYNQDPGFQTKVNQAVTQVSAARKNLVTVSQ